MNIPKARWYRIGLMLFLIYLVAFIDRSNIGMAAPTMVKTLGLSSTAIGVLLSVFFWGYIVTQLPGGWASGRYSAKKVIIASLLILGISAVFTGLVDSFKMLLFLRFVMGLAEGLLWPAFAIFFVNWYANNERARAVSFAEMAVPISSIIMAPLAGWMIETWDYKMMFLLQGIPPLLLAILVAWLVEDSPEKDRFISNEEREYILNNQTRDKQEKGSIFSIIGNLRIWVFCIVYFLWVMGIYSFGLWLPSLMKQLSNAGMGAVGLLTAIPFILAGVGMHINATLSDRRGTNQALFVAIPLSIGGIALIAQSFVGSNLIANIVVLMIAGIGLYSAFGPWWSWVMSFVPSNQAGTANGFINLCGNFGGVVGPIVVGAVSHNNDFSKGFTILGICLIIASLIVMLVIRRFEIPGAKIIGGTHVRSKTS
jgi:sugar phosphate permease